MSSKCAIKLIGEICKAEITEDRVRISASIGDQYASFEVPIFEQQSQGIAKLCWALGIMKLSEVSQFIGHRICLHVIQPQVAEGLIPHLVVVDFQGAK